MTSLGKEIAKDIYRFQSMQSVIDLINGNKKVYSTDPRAPEESRKWITPKLNGIDFNNYLVLDKDATFQMRISLFITPRSSETEDNNFYPFGRRNGGINPVDRSFFRKYEDAIKENKYFYRNIDQEFILNGTFYLEYKR